VLHNRKILATVILGLTLLALSPETHAVRWFDLSCTLEGAPGDGKLLVNGNPADGLEFPGSKTAPLAITIKVKIQGNKKIDRIDLVSNSINKWWSVPRVVVTGRRAGSQTWEPLADKPWYDRTSEPDSAISKAFLFSVPAGGKIYEELKIDLCRPHGYFHMPLQEIEVHIADGAELKTKIPWDHYQTGTRLKGTLECENSFPAPLEKAAVEIEMKDTESKTAGIWKKELSLPAGKSTQNFDIAVEKTGRFRLIPRLVSFTGYQAPVQCPSEFQAIPPRSKYWYPIGTNVGFNTQNYGFSVCHYWSGSIDVQVSGGGLYASCCGGWGIKPLAVPEKDRPIMKSDNTPGLDWSCSFHLPGYEVSDDYKQIFKSYDGHPLITEFIYANEWCYAGWKAGGLADYNKYAIRDYQKFLTERYKTLLAVNQLYQTKYASFDKIDPPRAHTPGPAWHDWMEFRRISVAGFFKKVYDQIKPNMPNTPIGPKPIHLTDSWTSMDAIDPWLWREAMDIYPTNVYPWSRDGYFEAPLEVDLHRTQIGGKKLIFPESGMAYFRPAVKDYAGLDFNRSYWPSFLRGLNGCYFFGWYAPWDTFQRRYWLCDETETLNEQGEAASRIAKQIQTLAPVLNFGKPLGIQTAVYFAWEEFDQAFNDVPNNALKGAYKILNQLHYPVDVITYHNVRAGELAKYRVLVLPGAKHLYPDVAKSIRTFVEQGGILIADQQAGFYDENHRPVRLLESVLGIRHVQESDRLTQLAMSGDQRIDLPAIVGGPCSRGEVIRVQDGTKVLGTFPKEILKPAAIDPVLLQAPIIGQFPAAKTPADTKGTGSPPPGLPAVAVYSFGKGKTLYIAAPIFNIYRNYFYDTSNGPYPVTRCNELQNQGNPIIRNIVADFLKDQRIIPPAEVNVSDPDPEVDDMHLQILSLFGNDHCAILGVTNWGPRQRYKVPATMDLPFEKAAKLYYMDTVREELFEIPFTQQARKLKTVIPFIEGTALLIAVGDGGPLLVRAEQPRSNPSMITVRIMNHLREKAEGKIQIRIDGIPEPLSSEIPFALAQGATASYQIPIRTVDEKLLLDNRGFRRPWYAWVTYDGTARSFGRIHPTGAMQAP
jgi:hypothetical protein